MERDCENCVHHTSNGCSKWNCQFETLAEHDKRIRAEVVEELVRLVCQYYTMQERAGYCADTNNMIKQRVADFAEQLKEQKR